MSRYGFLMKKEETQISPIHLLLQADDFQTEIEDVFLSYSCGYTEWLNYINQYCKKKNYLGRNDFYPQMELTLNQFRKWHYLH